MPSVLSEKKQVYKMGSSSSSYAAYRWFVKWEGCMQATPGIKVPIRTVSDLGLS